MGKKEGKKGNEKGRKGREKERSMEKKERKEGGRNEGREKESQEGEVELRKKRKNLCKTRAEHCTVCKSVILTTDLFQLNNSFLRCSKGTEKNCFSFCLFLCEKNF